MEAFPKTLNEAIDMIMHLMEREVLQMICTMPEENLAFFHDGFDTWIEVNTGLFEENYELLSDCKAKDTKEVSLIILNELRKHLISNKDKFSWLKENTNQ